MHVDHGTHHYTRAPQNYPSNQPRMFTSSQRKGGNNYYNQSQHPHQNPNQQLAHNPANLTAASATGGGVGFRHHSPKRVQGFNDPRQSYTQHTQPYQLTPVSAHGYLRQSIQRVSIGEILHNSLSEKSNFWVALLK